MVLLLDQPKCENPELINIFPNTIKNIYFYLDTMDVGDLICDHLFKRRVSNKKVIGRFSSILCMVSTHKLSLILIVF